MLAVFTKIIPEIYPTLLDAMNSNSPRSIHEISSGGGGAGDLYCLKLSISMNSLKYIDEIEF